VISPDGPVVNNTHRQSLSDELSVAQEEISQLELKIAGLEEEGVVKTNAISNLSKQIWIFICTHNY